MVSINGKKHTDRPDNDPTPLFEIQIRRQRGSAPLFTVRFSSHHGRGLLAQRISNTIKDSKLRTNGVISNLDIQDVLSGHFAFVPFAEGPEGRYRLWDRDPSTLATLKPGLWVSVRPRMLENNPFFILDTDTIDLPPIHDDAGAASPTGNARWLVEGDPDEPTALVEGDDDAVVLDESWVVSSTGRQVQDCSTTASPETSHTSRTVPTIVDFPGLLHFNREPPDTAPTWSKDWSRWEEADIIALPPPETRDAISAISVQTAPCEYDNSTVLVRYLREKLLHERTARARLETDLAELRHKLVQLEKRLVSPDDILKHSVD